MIMNEEEKRDLTRAVYDLALILGRELHGKPSYIQGAALADVVSMHIAGYPPAIRDEMLLAWIASLKQLIPANVAIIVRDYGEGAWDTPTTKAN